MLKIFWTSDGFASIGQAWRAHDRQGFFRKGHDDNARFRAYRAIPDIKICRFRRQVYSVGRGIEAYADIRIKHAEVRQLGHEPLRRQGRCTVYGEDVLDRKSTRLNSSH